MDAYGPMNIDMTRDETDSRPVENPDGAAPAPDSAVENAVAAVMGKDTYRVRLEDVFEGPMDLLVHLIKKNEVDIYDIPIALITDQYLGYLEWMKAMNIDVAGDFLVLAATLAQVKSRMLLPVHEDIEDEEDPRLEIARPLAEYLEMKSAAEQLARRDLLGESTFTRKPPRADLAVVPEDGMMIRVGLFELIDAFQKILENISPDRRVEFTAERISVKDRISQIVDILEKQKSITFNELFENAPDKSDIIITFLAILEMVKLTLVQMAQHVPTGVIRLFYL
jgi:segregation and condensation protein A